MSCAKVCSTLTHQSAIPYYFKHNPSPGWTASLITYTTHTHQPQNRLFFLCHTYVHHVTISWPNQGIILGRGPGSGKEIESHCKPHIAYTPQGVFFLHTLHITYITKKDTTFFFLHIHKEQNKFFTYIITYTTHMEGFS